MKKLLLIPFIFLLPTYPEVHVQQVVSPQPVLTVKPDIKKDPVDPIWQAFCADTAEHAVVYTVIYYEGTDKETYLYYDPDTCSATD